MTEKWNPDIKQPRLPSDSDSRLKGFFGQVSHPTLPLQRTYCFLCGKPWGYTSIESSQHVAPAHIVVTCDDCDLNIVEKYGKDGFPMDEIPRDLLDAFGIVPEKST
jgi:hypothetical protein